MDRRSLLRGAAVVGAAGVTGLAVPGAAHAAGPAGMPTYRYLRDALTLPLRYNPTGEFIFPCIRGVYDKISGARGRYHLYYAPHEKPGGICVAWANSLNGPFTEHTGNPIIDNVLPGGGTVSHVSSPHVTWDAATRQFFLYWHGENTTTRVARSSDGINFRDETPILSTRLVPGLTETSYARVFAHNGRYVMVYMGVLAGKRRIYHGWSPNGWDQWQFAQTPLVNPEPDGLTDISGPSLVFRNNTTYVAYHGNDGRMRLTEVGNALDRENHLGVFHSPAATDNGRAAAPSFGTDGGVEYMFYEAGPRLNARICIARAI
uniref:twin-arginine translocation signal domain-containing protein n=1 Tax=Paractinoplanes polyasparticus TaxID=2856853 RepID=UPI001C8411AC|nr:twin-arginine translocation signal domain-containing protein [Actinoplanes polyasparticus]